MTKSTKIKKFLAILLAIVLMASIIAPTASALPETDELTPTIENEIYVVEQEGALVFGENAFNDGNDINNEFEPSDDGFVYDVRPVARPVAGHFPTGFYRLFLRPNGSAGYVLEHNYGYYQSIEWYPAVPRAFLPNQAYTAIVTLEPHLTSLPEGGNGWWSVVFCDDPECENPHDAGDRVPPHNMDDPRGWALRPGVLNQYGVERPVWPPNFTSCTTTKPATFTGTTLEQLEGLPTDGVANIEIEEAGNNLVITIEFEPTGAVQPAIVTFFDDFSGEYNPYDRHGGITTHFARATDRMWRQHMSYWSMDNANIEVRDGNHILVLSNELIRETVDDYQAYINDLLLDYSWINPNARERENALRSGAVRTISHDWYEIYFEQSFGYWEARIQLPKERGMWGAFWLMNRYQGTNVNFHQGAAARQGRTGAELDIVEAIISSAANYNNSQFNSAFHWNGWGGMVDGVWQGSRSFSMGSNRNAAHGFDIFDGNWHTFSMEWTPTSYTMFINGVEYGRHEFGMGSGNRAVHQISHNPTYIKLSTEAGGASSTPAAWPLGAGMHFRDDFFSEMLVDYVRVWNGPRPESSAFATPATLVDVEVTGNAVPNLYLDAYAVSNPPGQPLSPNATYQWQHGPTPDGPWTNVPNRPLGTGQVAGPNRQTNHIPSAVTTNRRLYLVEQDMDNLSNFIRVVVTHAGDSLNSEAIPFREVAEELDIAIRGVPAVAQSLTADVYPVTHAHTFRWQLSPDGGETWNNVTGAAGASPTILLTAPHHNQLARIAVTNGAGQTTYSDPVGPIARTGVRYIVTPVAGHFPTSLYRWPFRHNAGDTGAGNVGFNSTITWYPAVETYFQPDTVYTATLTLDTNPQWAAANRPGSAALGGGANFAAAGLTHANIAGVPTAGGPVVYTQHPLGLPTGGATAVSSAHDNGSLVITIQFAATGELEEATLILDEDFTAGPSVNPAIGQPQRVTDRFVRSIVGVRQGMSTWQNNMSFIRDDNLVLGFERMDPSEVTDAMIWDWTWCNITNGPLARQHYIRSGSVRTMGQAWSGLNSEKTFEHAFGYYEARIKFPDARGGTWGAFWLMNRLQGQTSAAQQSATGFNHTFHGRGGAEIDIIESIAAHSNHGFNAATHFDSWQTGHQGSWPGNADTLGGMNIYDGGWHTFSVEWAPNDYRFFINGFEFARLSDLSTNLFLRVGEGGWPGLTSGEYLEVNQNPNYVKLSMEAAVWNLIAQGALIENSGEMLVDWVRVWNGPRPASAYTPENHGDMPEQRVTLAAVNATGNAVVGQTLTAEIVTQPDDLPLPVSPATFQWERRLSITGTWMTIPGATAETLVLTPAFLGNDIRVRAMHGGLTRVSNVLGLVSVAPVVFDGTNPNRLRDLFEESNNIVLTTRGNLGIFEQHSVFVIPEGVTLTVTTAFNAQRNATILVEGTLIIADGGRLNGQAGGTIRVADGGTLIIHGVAENMTTSTFINAGEITITDTGRLNIRAGAYYCLTDGEFLEGAADIRNGAIPLQS